MTDAPTPSGLNKLLDERVRVHCRIKPRTTKDVINPLEASYEYSSADKTVTVTGTSTRKTSMVCNFTSVISPKSTQDDVYDTVAQDVVQAALDGFNGTVFAYGQTGTGKTYTMLGLEDNYRDVSTVTKPVDPATRGIIPRAVEHIFAHVAQEEAKGWNISVSVSYLQIYCEMITDLLRQPDGRRQNLSIRNDTNNGGRSVYVEGASSIRVDSPFEALRLMKVGNGNRVTALTNMNAHSSRSHAAFVLTLEKTQTSDCDTEDAPQAVRSQLFLVDLAGSERVKHITGADGHGSYTRLSELRAINLSLSALGNCIAALSQQQQDRRAHVPYRDSKLTRLLQNSLGGNARTALVVTVPHPFDLIGTTTGRQHEREQMVSALKFGLRANKVSVSARINVKVDYKRLYDELVRDKDHHEDALHQLEIKLEDIEHQLDDATANEEDMAAKIEALEAELDATNEKNVQLANALDAADAASAEGDAQVSVQALQIQWQEDTAQLQAQFEKNMARAKQRFVIQLEEERSRAERFSNDWHDIEMQLTESKQAQLEGLQRYAALKAECVDLEKDSTERIADLMIKVEDQAAVIRELEEELAKGGSGLNDDQVKTIRERVEERVLHDFVSREKVMEMKELYEGLLEKLTSRVDKLEQESVRQQKLHKEQSNKMAAASQRRGDGRARHARTRRSIRAHGNLSPRTRYGSSRRSKGASKRGAYASAKRRATSTRGASTRGASTRGASARGGVKGPSALYGNRVNSRGSQFSRAKSSRSKTRAASSHVSTIRNRQKRKPSAWTSRKVAGSAAGKSLLKAKISVPRYTTSAAVRSSARAMAGPRQSRGSSRTQGRTQRQRGAAKPSKSRISSRLSHVIGNSRFRR